MKKVAAVAILGGAALAARRYLSMRDALAAVPADMRSPVLPFVSGTISRRMLPLYRLQSRVRTASGRGVTVAKRYVGDSAIPVLVTTPIEGRRPRPGVLWIHGGGYILGSPQMEAFGTGRLARDLGVVTVSPDYRLAPEHSFPAALDDCMATLRWMRANADGLGIDPDRIAVMGAACTEAVGRAGVRSAGAAPGSDRTATGVGWGRRTRPVPRRGRRLCREAESLRGSVRARHGLGDVSRGGRSRAESAVTEGPSRWHG